MQTNRLANFGEYQRHPEKYVAAEVLVAPDTLDPDGFMARRVTQLAAERLEWVEQHPLARTSRMMDLIGAAALVRETENAGNDATIERENLRMEIRTALFEILQECGHVSTIRSSVNQNGEAGVGQFVHWQMWLNGLHPDRPDWANQRAAINVYSEFLSAAHFGREDLRRNYIRVELSPLPADIIGAEADLTEVQQQELDHMLKSEGYRLDSRKWMLRSEEFKPVNTLQTDWERELQQISCSGSDLEIINRLKRELGALEIDMPDEDSEQLLRRSFLLPKAKFPYGVVHFVQMADILKEEQISEPHFCGKPVKNQPTSDLYRHLPQVSAQREAVVAYFINELETEAYRLDVAGISRDEQNNQFKKALFSVVQRICASNPEYAEHAFGATAAVYYKLAHEAERRGDRQGSSAALASAIENSNTMVMCGVEVNMDTAAENSGTMSAARLDEVRHCMELKVYGFTVRNEVACPKCTVEYKGPRVRAHETESHITCMSDRCGYQLNKITGRISRNSLLDLLNQKTPVSESAETGGTKPAMAINPRARRPVKQLRALGIGGTYAVNEVPNTQPVAA